LNNHKNLAIVCRASDSDKMYEMFVSRITPGGMTII